MNAPPQKRPKTKYWITAVIVGLIAIWLIADWEDFKRGLLGGDAEAKRMSP